jgi:hypothetical protein
VAINCWCWRPASGPQMTCSVAIQRAIESRVHSGDPVHAHLMSCLPFRIDNLKRLRLRIHHVGTVQLFSQKLLVSKFRSICEGIFLLSSLRRGQLRLSASSTPLFLPAKDVIDKRFPDAAISLVAPCQPVSIHKPIVNGHWLKETLTKM